MTASTLGSANILSGGTYTASAGSSRRVVAIGTMRRDTGTPVYSATFGGVSMTRDLITPFVGDDTIAFFSLPESSIPSGSQTFTVTASGGTILTPFHGQIYTLGGMNQTTALDSGFSTTGSATSVASITTASVTNTSGSILMAGVRNSTGDNFTVSPASWTEDRDDASVAGRCYFGHRDNVTGATATYTWTAATANWFWQLGAYLAAASGPAISVLSANHRRRRRG